jgi:large subunit ribosomal protein L15
MPLYRKLPHRGFNNYEHRTSYAVINVGDLANLDAKITEVNAEVLGKAGLIRGDITMLKVLGDGEISRALKVTAQKFTGSAKAKLEKAGGQVAFSRRKTFAFRSRLEIQKRNYGEAAPPESGGQK